MPMTNRRKLSLKKLDNFLLILILVSIMRFIRLRCGLLASLATCTGAPLN